MIAGGCLCGRVRYEADGEALFRVVCHCRECQRASGTGHVPVIGVYKKDFRLNGEPKSYVMAGGSGQPVARHFCPDCGSLLFSLPEIAPHIVTIYVGGLDDAAAFKPQHAQFIGQRPEWARIAPGVTEYEKAGVITLEGL